MKSYDDLEIYQSAYQLAKQVHMMAMNLPKHEMYELGSQVRRSAQSIRATIVEGYGRRKYTNEFTKFLVYAEASLLETESHLKMIGEIYNLPGITELVEKYNLLGKQLNRFIAFVETSWNR